MKNCEQDNFAQRTATIRHLNDEFRTSGRGGLTLMTQGIQQLGIMHQLSIIDAVRNFNELDEGNDPHGEHDFGSIDYIGQKLFWKIDYYDCDLEMGSPDPADESVTARVMTVMLANEY